MVCDPPRTLFVDRDRTIPEKTEKLARCGDHEQTVNTIRFNAPIYEPSCSEELAGAIRHIGPGRIITRECSVQSETGWLQIETGWLQ